MSTFYPINTPLINYYFYKAPLTQLGPNIPLAGGFLFFFDDNDHNIPLPTYSDVSNPNAPVANLNPIELGAAGDCPLFYLEDRPYYIVITDSNGDIDNPITTINHYNPGNGSGTTSPTSIPNYISNGQFLLHNDIHATATTVAGQITQDSTEIADGNWTFDVQPGTTSINIVTFERYNSFETNPTANPLYAVRVQCTEVDTADTYKDLTKTFPDVNRFASANQQYTVSFSGINNVAGSVAVQLVLYKYFGSGGSAPVETILTTFNLTSTQSLFSYSFIFGSNAGKTIGVNNDSYVSIGFRSPLLTTSDISMTNFLLELGNVTNPAYPETTQEEDVSNSLGGGFPVPSYTGYDIGLMPIKTKNGWDYDDSVVGFIMPTLLRTAPNYWLLADGTSYKYDDYSSIGIPYKRIADKLWDNTNLCFITGSGYQFVSAQLADVTSPGAEFRLTTNQAGAQTAAADGAIATGFTFKPVATGGSYGMTGKFGGITSISIKNNTLGTTWTGPGDTGFAYTVYKNLATAYGLVNLVIDQTVASLSGKYIYAGLSAGTHYYFWFTVDGVGADPAPGGTGNQINLFSNFNASEIGKVICEAVSGNTVSEIICGAAASVTAGSYWRFSANSQNYLVYQVKAGVGTDPNLPGVISIPAYIGATDTAAQVAAANIAAVNKFYVGMPDLRGWSFRVWNNGASMDPDVATRFSSLSNITGDNLATYQWDIFMQHQHTYSLPTASTTLVQGAIDQTVVHTLTNTPTETSYPSDNAGGPETRSADFYINALIKY